MNKTLLLSLASLIALTFNVSAAEMSAAEHTAAAAFDTQQANFHRKLATSHRSAASISASAAKHGLQRKHNASALQEDGIAKDLDASALEHQKLANP